jgi:hypothetical protein
MTKAVPYATLVGLLGKKVKDDAVQAVIAKAGKVSVKSDFIVAKGAAFDFALDKKVLSTLFLNPGYPDLPRGFSFTTRDALLGALPAPGKTWKLGKGKVLAVTGVDFYAKGQTSYVRGIGAEVEFGGYPAALSHGVALGEARASVGKKRSAAYGKGKAGDDHDYWKPKARVVSAEFAKGKLVHHIGLPADY